jgi:nucleoside-diphosphate-sugar epimerase
MPTALITGAAGFVGRHFTTHLRDLGWKVYATDVSYAAHLTDQIDARDLFGGAYGLPDLDLVLHCAAVVGGRQVIDVDPLAQAVNLELDAALFRWARQVRPGRVVYFSSSAVYPVDLQKAHDRCRLAENLVDAHLPYPTVGVPDQLYGWSKLTGEHLACRAQAEGVAVTVVRPFSGYGADQEDCYPFPAFVDRALRREDPFLIWGTGDQVRDFVHIDDIVAATMELVYRSHNGPVNLGTGQGTSLRQLAQRVCAAAGHSPEYEVVPVAPSGVAYRVCDPGRLMSIRAPRITLQQGISWALAYRGESITRA